MPSLNADSRELFDQPSVQMRGSDEKWRKPCPSSSQSDISVQNGIHGCCIIRSLSIVPVRKLKASRNSKQVHVLQDIIM